jgi:putative transcriptional regulator
MGLPEKLQRLREQAGLSQAALADKAGVPARSIQNWEQGHRAPRAPALLALARALEVPVETLIRALEADKPRSGRSSTAEKRPTRPSPRKGPKKRGKGK